MAAPGTNPYWATDTNFTSGPDTGTPTKVAPSAGVEAQGHTPATRAPAQHQNWWQNLVGQWIAFFYGRLGGLTGAGEWTYETARARTVEVPVSTGIAQDDAGSGVEWTTRAVSQTGGYSILWYATDRNKFLFFDLDAHVPSGATNVFVDVMVTPGFAGTGVTRMAFRVEECTEDWVAPFVGHTIAHFGEVTDDGTAVLQKVTVTGPTSVDKSTKQYRLRIESSDDGAGAAGDYVQGVRIRFDDPGPRNF